MSNVKPTSLDWLDDLAALTAQQEKTPDASHKELAKALNTSRPTITLLLGIKPIFDQEAINKTRQAALAATPYILSLNSAKALAGLNGKVTDLSIAVHAALNVILAHRLATKQIKSLVKWMKAGNSAESFDPKAKPPKDEETSESDNGANGNNNRPLAQPNLAPQLVASVQVRSGSGKGGKTKRGNSKKVKTQTFGQRIGSGIDKIVSFFGGGSPQSPAEAVEDSEAIATPQKSRKNKKGKGAVSHWLKKHGKKLAKKTAKFPLKEIVKVEHRICKKLAHAIVSSRRSSHSSSSRRSGRPRSRGSFRQGLITLFLTPLHGVVYVLLQYGFLFMVATVFIFPFFPALKPLLEWPFRFAAHLALYDLPSWVWACAHNYLVPTLVIGVVLAIGLVFAWQAEPLRMTLINAALVYLIIHGRGWAVEPAPWDKPIVSETPAVSALPAEAKPVRSSELGSSKLKSKASNSSLRTANSMSVAAYQPAVSFIPSPSSTQTLYDPKILEQEIAAIPANSIIKDYVYQPDEGMPADLAVSRLQDLTDTDKYTMMIGSGKQKILSVIPSNTNFIITYKSTDPFNVFGNSSGTMNIFLEDVQYIHVNEIDHFSRPPTANAAGISSFSGTQPDIKYQCTVVAKGEKYPLTIQCDSKDDLENLVSTLEYFIRHSRLGRDAQPGGLPFPTQGIRFNNDRVVTLLWANSPMDKGGMGLGDHLWSVGKNTSEQQSRKELEAALQGAAQGLVLYAVSPNEWEKAAIAARDPGSDNSFRPQLKKVSLPQ